MQRSIHRQWPGIFFNTDGNYVVCCCVFKYASRYITLLKFKAERLCGIQAILLEARVVVGVWITECRRVHYVHHHCRDCEHFYMPSSTSSKTGNLNERQKYLTRNKRRGSDLTIRNEEKKKRKKRKKEKKKENKTQKKTHKKRNEFQMNSKPFRLSF